MLQQFNIHTAQKKLLSEAITEYLHYCTIQQISKHHQANKRIWLGKFLKFVGDICITEVTAQHYERYRDKMISSKRYTISTQNNYLRTFKTFFNWLVESDQLLFSPLRKVKAIKQIDYEPEIPPEEAIQRLLTEAPLHLQYMLSVLVYTGVRRGEMFNLKFSNINFDENIITITSDRDSGFITKNKKTRHIPIHPVLKEKLLFLEQNWICPHFNIISPREPHQRQYLFCHRNGKNIKDIKTTWNKAKARAGYPNLKIHHLRHFFCSVLHKYTNDIYFVSRVLGHSDIQVTQRYCHLLGGYTQQQILKMPVIG